MILTDPRNLASLQRGDKFSGTGSQAKNRLMKQAKPEVDELLRTIRDNIEASWKTTEKWRIDAEENYAFAENDQWDEETLKTLKAEGRPSVTMNKILPILRMLSGLERQNRMDMKVFPRNGGATDDADIMTQLVKFVDDDNLAMFKRSRKSNDVNITGRGYLETDISYDENLMGDIVIRRRNPLSVFDDPLADEWDYSDGRWIAVGDWMTEEEAKELWPEFDDVIKVGDWLKGSSLPSGSQYSGDRLSLDSLFIDQRTKRVRVFDYWYKKREVVRLAINTATGDVRPATPKFLAKVPMLPPDEQANLRLIDRKMTTIRVATVMNWLVLQDKASPFEHGMFPITRYLGIQFYRQPNGIVHYLKDPQKISNKARAQMLNHLNRSGNSGWLNQKGQGADPALLEKFGSSPGVVIEWDKSKPERIEPVQLSTGHFQLAKEADEEVQSISGVNAELLGFTTHSSTVSGRAIDLRKQGGLTGNEDLFDNALMGDKILGLQLIGCIQQTYTPERVQRVIANRKLREPDSPVAQLMARVQAGPGAPPEPGMPPPPPPPNLDDLIERCLKADYDYIVDRAPASVSVREAQYKDLKEMVGEFFKGAPPPVLAKVGELLTDFSDYPENIKGKLKEVFAMMSGPPPGPMGPGGPMPGGPVGPDGQPLPPPAVMAAVVARAKAQAGNRRQR